MKKYFLLIGFLSYFTSVLAQLEALPVTIIDNIGKSQAYIPNTKYKSAAQPKSCTPDTIEYARYKGSAFQGIAISNGFALGQYYDAPDTIEVSGATFYGWAITTGSKKVTVTVSLYNVGIDSLPTGLALRTTTIDLDSTFGGGVLTTLRKSVAFDSVYKTNQPYIITISSGDSIRAGVVCNSYANGDGASENIMCGTVSNIWYRCLNLNIGGATLNCDALLEPHAKYKIYAGFSILNCFQWQDSITPTNSSSPLLKHRMYNRYMSYGLGQYSYYWYYGIGTNTLYGENPKMKLNSPSNRNVRLITTMYSYRNTNNCSDTAFQDIFYQPAPIAFSVDTPVCSGKSTPIIAFTDAPVYWYAGSGSTLIDSGKTFTTPTLTTNTVYSAVAINNTCITSKKSVLVPVAEQPSNPLTSNDSICLNAKANLSATSDYGVIQWFTDSLNGKPIYSGNVYVSNSLINSTTYYAQANNRGCLSSKRVAAVANVNANNAPKDPITTIDSLICLHNGTVMLHATSPSNDAIAWYDVPSGGTSIHSGETYTYTPTTLGTKYLYVEANDGQCASSRLQKSVLTWTFPQVSIKAKDTLCLGDTLTVLYDKFNGSMRWYDSPTSGTELYDNDTVKLSGLSGNVTYYLEPYSQGCKDTVRHKLVVSELDPGKLSTINGATICANKSAILTGTTSAGEIVWTTSPSLNDAVATGNSYTTDALNMNTTYYAVSKNLQCLGDFTPVDVTVKPAPGSGFNYQVNGIGDFTFIADDAGLTYLWSLGDGTTKANKAINHQYKTNANFEVVLKTTATNGCSSSSSRTVKVAGLINSISVLGNNKISIYPNPTKERVFIDTDESDLQLEVIDQLGKIYITENLVQGLNDIDLVQLMLPSGIYYLKVSNDSSTSFYKLSIHN
jgi:hypothetical protein